MVVHHRDRFPFEISIVAERTKYCRLSLRWLESQGELPNTPILLDRAAASRLEDQQGHHGTGLCTLPLLICLNPYILLMADYTSIVSLVRLHTLFLRDLHRCVWGCCQCSYIRPAPLRWRKLHDVCRCARHVCKRACRPADSEPCSAPPVSRQNAPQSLYGVSGSYKSCIAIFFRGSLAVLSPK